MTYTEFYCDSVNGNNMFGGSDAGSASFSSTNGNWDGSSVFTLGSGTVSGVAAGQFAHVFVDGSTTPVYFARVLSSTSNTITLSTTAKAGAAPSSNATARSINVGGAWKGPNGAVPFPFNTMAGAAVDSSSHQPRVNFKNNGVYNITAGITHTVAGQIMWQGYSSAVGDLGRAVIDGGTSGASYALITLATFGSTLADLTFQNNGASGTAAGVVIGTSNGYRLICHDVRGSAYSVNSTAELEECEAYNFNQANTNASGAGLGFQGNSSSAHVHRCYAHDAAAGVNCHGFGQLGTFTKCIADSLAGAGLVNASAAGGALIRFIDCDVYNCVNGLDVSLGNQTSMVYAENCNFIKNSAFGIKANGTGLVTGLIINCGFGAGTQVNGSGSTTYAATTGIIETGSFNYPSNVTPWAAPSTGNFSIVLPNAFGAGRGVFTQTGSSKTGTVGYPDVGAAPHLDSTFVSPNITIHEVRYA